MNVKAGTTVLLILATTLFVEGSDRQKATDYPLALEVHETESAGTFHDVSLVEASDGNIYSIACPVAGGGLVGMLTNPRCDDVTLVPGTVYRARWQKGNLRILITDNDRQGSAKKSREATFTVVGSKKMSTEESSRCKVCVLAKEQ